MRADEFERHLGLLSPAGETSASELDTIRTAAELFHAGNPAHRVDGAVLARRHPWLLHYTTDRGRDAIRAAGSIGLSEHGVWLTPTIYAGCMVPYNLGLSTPVTAAIVIETAELVELWGPGFAAPSQAHDAWGGSGIEFYCPSPIPFSAAVDIVKIQPCGDTHR